MKTTKRYTEEQHAGFLKLRRDNVATVRIVKDLFTKIDEDCGIIKEVSERAGVHRQQVSHYRRGTYTPRIDIFEALANAAGYDVVLVKRHCAG